MRKMMHNAVSMYAAANTAEASSCACSAMNIALILDAGILASIIISLISLLALILEHFDNIRLKDLQPYFT